MIRIAEQRWLPLRAELAPLFLEHHAELTDPEFRDSEPLDVDWDLYATAEANGKLMLVTARADRALIGYTVSFLQNDPHRRTRLVCWVDTYWIRPDWREPNGDSLATLGSTGAQLIVATEDAAAARGAVKIVNHTRFWADNGPLFDMLGYKPIERVSVKRLAGA